MDNIPSSWIIFYLILRKSSNTFIWNFLLLLISRNFNNPISYRIAFLVQQAFILCIRFYLTVKWKAWTTSRLFSIFRHEFLNSNSVNLTTLPLIYSHQNLFRIFSVLFSPVTSISSRFQVIPFTFCSRKRKKVCLKQTIHHWRRIKMCWSTCLSNEYYI